MNEETIGAIAAVFSAIAGGVAVASLAATVRGLRQQAAQRRLERENARLALEVKYRDGHVEKYEPHSEKAREALESALHEIKSA